VRSLLAAAAALASHPVAAQHAGHAMPGMAMPAKPARTPSPRSAPPPTEQVEADPHAGHSGHGGPARAEAAPRDGAEEARPATPAGTDLPAGAAPAPAARTDHLADRYWDPAAMARARAGLRREHGGMTYHQLLLNVAEYRAGAGRDGYRWDGEAWAGGDEHRLVLRSEGRGDLGGRAEQAEVQALYGRALDPYWNLQAGVRRDLAGPARRTWASVGVEGLAPYWFDVEATLFFSDRGELTARGEAWYDQRVTQFLVLQPRLEVNLAVQEVGADAGRAGGAAASAGVSDVELGLRLRWEKSRRFAPYAGVSWERAYGRPRGGDGGLAFVTGVRAWL